MTRPGRSTANPVLVVPFLTVLSAATFLLAIASLQGMQTVPGDEEDCWNAAKADIRGAS